MEIWLTLIMGLPSTILAALQIYKMWQDHHKQSDKEATGQLQSSSQISETE